jgi:MoaA/NifB/PqqE/SkfB family radical SAM enzyme
MCTTGKGKYSGEGELSTKNWQRLILNLSESCDIERITFGGGEPLLRKDLGSVIKISCSTHIKTVNVITNGTLFGPNFIKQFSKEELKKIGIIFSIDGLEREHNFIRDSDIFKLVIEHFRYLYHFYYKKGIINDLSISSILMPENFAYYMDFLEMVKNDYPGIKVDIQPVIPNNEICYIKEKFDLTKKEERALSQIVEYIKKNPYISQRPLYIVESYIDYFHNNLAKANSCLTGTKSLNITYEGKPYLCGVELNLPLYIYSFKDVYYSQEYQKGLERIAQCHEPCLQGLHINPDNYKK